MVVFEEFYDSLMIQEMLTLLDGYPLDLPCRYNNKIACYTKVYILSNVDLSEQYMDAQVRSREAWNAFVRRIHAVKVFDEKGITDYKSPEEYLQRFVPCTVSAWDKDPKSEYRQQMLDLKRGR